MVLCGYVTREYARPFMDLIELQHLLLNTHCICIFILNIIILGALKMLTCRQLSEVDNDALHLEVIARRTTNYIVLKMGLVAF